MVFGGFGWFWMVLGCLFNVFEKGKGTSNKPNGFRRIKFMGLALG